MKNVKTVLLFALLGFSSLVRGQDFLPTDASPIITVVSEVGVFALKGMTNRQQRLNIKRQWALEAAMQLEKLLQKEQFEKIIELVAKNCDLFEQVYAGYKTARSSIRLLDKARHVTVLQHEILRLYGEVGELIGSTKAFTPEELEVLAHTLQGIMRSTVADGELLFGAFTGLFDAHLSDYEKLALLDQVHTQLTTNKSRILVLHRQVAYLAANRATPGADGVRALYKTKP